MSLDGRSAGETVDVLTGLSEIQFIKYKNSTQCPYKLDSDAPTYSGSFGTVSRYLDADGRQVAIKQIPLKANAQHTSSADLFQMIKTEIGVLRICHHTNLLKFIGAYTIDTVDVSRPTVFLVTSPWATSNLSDFLETVRASTLSDHAWWNQCMPLERCKHMFSGLLSGLSYLHKHNIMHKDVKPENILLNGRTPIIADFGISKIYRPFRTTFFTRSTVQYLAPEQINHVESSPKADVFALGCCFLLIYAAAHRGREGMNRILDAVLEPPGSCQYGRELSRLIPIIRSIEQEPTLLMFLVRDMMLENPQLRPSCDYLEYALQKFSSIQVKPDNRGTIQLYASPSSFDNTGLICTKLLLNDIIEVVHKNSTAKSTLDTQWTSHVLVTDRDNVIEDLFHLTMDTGSPMNLISTNVLQRIETRSQLRHQAIRPVEVCTLTGTVLLSSTIELRLQMKDHDEIRLGIFYVVPEQYESHFEILVGRKFLLANSLIMIERAKIPCIF